MKDLVIFRTFCLFPLIGLLFPDILTKFYSPHIAIPVEHVIVEVTLAISVFICSVGIWYIEYYQYFRPLYARKAIEEISPISARKVSRNFSKRLRRNASRPARQLVKEF